MRRKGWPSTESSPKPHPTPTSAALPIPPGDLAEFLAGTGRPEGTVTLAQEGVDIYRELAQASPDVHLGGLASSLEHLAARLAEVGRRDEALRLAQEAVDIHRELAQASPGTYLGSLALARG